MELTTVLKSLFFIGLVLAADFLGVRAADSIAQKSTKPFDKIELDWYSRSADCYVGRVFLLYRYQYCYYVLNDIGEKSEWKAILFYHKPRAIFNYTRVFMSTSYYFNELPYGERVQIFTYNEGNT